MSKFFVQLLLSAVIGVGAAVGFRTEMRGELNKTLREAKVIINERANVDLKSTGDMKAQANTALSVSSKGITRISAKVNAKSDTKGKGSLNTQLNTGGALSNNLVTDLSPSGSLIANSQTNIGSNMQGLDLDLKNRINSTMDLGPGLLE